MPTRAELLRRLPNINGSQSISIGTSIMAGLRSGLYDPLELVENTTVTGGFWGRQYVFRQDRDHNVLTRGNVVRRRMLSFSGSNRVFMSSVNGALGGGETYPMTVLVGGIALSLATAGMATAVGIAAGAVYGTVTTAIDMSRTTHPVRARLGDEVYLVEIMGKRGNTILHLEQVYLTDPHRKAARVQPFEWLIHNQESEVHFD